MMWVFRTLRMSWRLIFAFSCLTCFMSPALSGTDDEELPPDKKHVVLAGGDFDLVFRNFADLEGVLHVETGYTGGTVSAPTLLDVARGGTGHFEAVRVVYDANRMSFVELIDYYWRTIDPFDDRGQICNLGDEYRPAVFIASEEQRAIVEASISRLEAELGRDIKTFVLAAQSFWPSQHNFERSQAEIDHYLSMCSGERELKTIWGENAAEKLAEVYWPEPENDD